MNIRSLAVLFTLGLFLASGLPSEACAQWVQTAGPYGGTVSTMAVLGANTAHPVVFAGTVAGVFRSSDSGAHWVNATPGLTNPMVYDFAVLDTDIFAATGNGVYRSTDKGRSWRNANEGLSAFEPVSAMAVMGTKPSSEILFASVPYGGIFCSTNRGASWILADSSLPNSSSVLAFATMGTELFAGSYGGVFRSDDSGKSWSLDANGLSSSSQVTTFAVMGTSIFAGTYNGIFLSADSGVSWAPASSGQEGTDVITLAASGPALYAGGGYGFFESNDQGANWTPEYSGLTGMTVEAISVLDTASDGSAGALFAGTSSSGILESPDGGVDWFPTDSGLIIANITALTVLGPDVFAGTDNSMFGSTDDGGSWQTLNLGNGLNTTTTGVSSLATDGSTLFAASSSSYSSSLLFSTDSGVTWTNPSYGSYSSVSIDALLPIVEPAGTSGSSTILFAGTTAGIFQSPDYGTTWIDASTGLPANDLTVYSFAQSSANLYCGTDAGGVFYSSDSGKTWNDISPNTSTSLVSNIQALALSGTTLFAGMNNAYGLGSGSGGVLQSTDNGQNWNSENGVTGNVAALLTLGTNIFAATDAGISVSTNDGAVWSDASDGLNGAAVTALAIRGPYLYAGTAGAGVWRRPLAEMIGPASVKSSAALASGEQNYPNPFTTRTTIPFSLSNSGHVTVKIFDMLGNEIATLANQDMGAGPHEVVWNPGAAPSGSYVCRIASSDGVETQSLVLVAGGSR